MPDNSDGRPDPDDLLERIERNEIKNSKGRIKIFLGYSAGVGKTYSMLEEAHRKKAQSIDVMVGYIASHGRKETEELIIGLKTIPHKTQYYRGVKIDEMDIDAILARHPQLVLVDELAHTNAPGSRHAKRYQDVKELLDAGIDVYTTLNIQHLESMNDTVAQVTGIKVKETLPDVFLDEANEIKIVDLPPEELIQRFKEGKVYVPEHAEIAMENFFNVGNLIALREMTFRRAAEHVDEQMMEYMHERSIPGPWPAGERLLVCIGNNRTLNERVVRTGRKLAAELKAEWFALYVDTAASNRLSKTSRQEATRGLEMAASLGAMTSTTFGISIAEGVVRFARNNNITRIIVGRPLRAAWQEILFGSVADQIVRTAGAIDLIVITEPGTKEVEKRNILWRPELRSKPNAYWYSLWLVMLISLLGFIVKPFISPTNLVMFYLAGVVIAAISWGLWPAIFTSTISVLAFDFLFVPPTLTFRVNDSEYVITFVAFLFVGVAISLLVARGQEYAIAAQRREEHTSTLYALSMDLAATNDVEKVLEIVSIHVARSINCRSAFLLPEDGVLKLAYYSKGLRIDEKEFTAANWTFNNDIMAGLDTDTLSTASLRYYPLRTSNGAIGVMGIKPEEPDDLDSMERERLINAFANQAALAIERGTLWRIVCEGERHERVDPPDQ